MARRSSGRKSGGGFSRSRPASKASKSTTPVPAKSPAPVKSEPASGGLGAAIIYGLAWGGGNAIAHRVADAIMGPSGVRYETVESAAPATQAAPSTAIPDACAGQNKAFEECLNSSGNDISQCQFYMDMLTQCRKASPSTSPSIVM